MHLMLGDCLERMGEIPDGSVDLILADLPYGVTACKWDSIIPLELLWDHYRRLLRPKGAVVLTASQPFTSKLVMSNPAQFRYEWIWDKGIGTNFQQARFQPLKSHESILVFSPSPAVFTKNGECMYYSPQRSPRDPKDLRPYPNGYGSGVLHNPILKAKGDQYDEATKLPVSIIRVSGRCGECNSRRRLHTSQKPEALFGYLVNTYSRPGDVVMDNAMGSGTTGVACINTGRSFIGIERDPGYFAMAQARIAAAMATAAA